jgi:winged helix DNA-binding protein
VVERMLTAQELNRALLARQLLLERAELPLPRALERVAGIQAQYAPSSYIGLWSRLEGFEREDLTRALERRTVVQGTLMRVTIHLVSARDYPLLAEGVRERRRQWWLTSHRGRADARKIAATARRAHSFLAAGPRRRSELVEYLGADNVTWNGVGVWIDLVRAPPSGTWEQRRADLYATADDWLGPSDATPEQGLDLLVRRYLGGFGPASLKDVASWAGLPAKMLAPAVERLRLRRFRDETGAELVDIPRGALPDADTPAPVRFLPTWDATLLVHARRTQILPEYYRPLVFNTKTPQSMSTFLVDGRVAGTWKHERGRVHVEPFERLPRDVRRELDEEGERLVAFLS